MTDLGKLHAIGGSGCTPLSKHVLRHPILTAVNTQLHSPFHCLTTCPHTHRAKSQTCQVLLFVNIFLHNFWGFILIPKSYAIFWNYDDKLMFMFSWYTFEDTFPKVVILTWCILGALDQMCRASFRAHKQTVISQPRQNHRRWNRKHILASILLNGSKTTSSKTFCASAEWKDYAFCKACHKSVKVTVSVQYNDMRHCQSDVHLHVVTKRCADPANTDFLCFFGQILRSPMLNTMVWGFRCLTGLKSLTNKEQSIPTTTVLTMLCCKTHSLGTPSPPLNTSPVKTALASHFRTY